LAAFSFSRISTPFKCSPLLLFLGFLVKRQKTIQKSEPRQTSFFDFSHGGNVMMLTKEELTAAILASAVKLGKTPTRGELMALSGATPRNVRKHFGSYQSAMEACGLEINGAGKKVTMQSLFQDWTGIVRTLKKVPSLMEYEQLSRYSVRPMLRMFGMWVNMPDGIKMYI